MSLPPIPLGDTVSLVAEQPDCGIVVAQPPSSSAFISQLDAATLAASVALPAALITQSDESSAQVVQTPSERALVAQDAGASALAVQSERGIHGDITPTMLLLFSSSGGPPGQPGTASEVSVQIVAGENLSSGRFVVIYNGQAMLFNPAQSAHSGRGFGVTVTSAIAGQPVSVKQNGTITDAAFAFSDDVPVFATTNGEIAESPPVSGLVQQVGVAVAPGQLFINIMPTVARI